MALGNAGVHAILIICTVACDGGHRARDVVEQGANLRAVISLAACHHRGHDLAGVGVHAEVEFFPGPSRFGAVLLDLPLTRTTQLQPRAVHEQMHGLGLAPSTSATARPWPRYMQGRGPAA